MDLGNGFSMHLARGWTSREKIGYPCKKKADKRAYMLASVLLFTMDICIFVTSRDNIALCLHGFVETKDSKSSIREKGLSPPEPRQGGIRARLSPCGNSSF